MLSLDTSLLVVTLVTWPRCGLAGCCAAQSLFLHPSPRLCFLAHVFFKGLSFRLNHCLSLPSS